MYREKTGNEWGTKGRKIAGKFYPLDIDYGHSKDIEEELGSGPDSKLPQEIQQFVRMLFDVKRMKKAMSEFEVCAGLENIVWVI